jgi:hypothetical protein
MAFRCFLALLSAYLYLREIGCAGLPSLLGASGWAFCDYLVFYAGYPLSTAAAPFPLLLLGLRRLARDADRRALGLTVAALLLVTTAGHPETLLHAVAAGGVFFLFDLAAAPRERRWRSLRLAAAAGILTLGLSAVFLLPFLENAPWTAEFHHRRTWFAAARRSVPIGQALERSSIDLVPYSVGEFGRGRFDPNVIDPASYAGSLLLPLALLGFASKRREKWPLALTGAVGVAAWAKLPGFADALAKIPVFHMALNERLAFAAAFATAGLAALGADLLVREPRRFRAFAISAAAGALVLLLLNLRLLPRLETIGMTTARLREHALIQLVPIAAAVILLGVTAVRRRGRVAAACPPRDPSRRTPARGGLDLSTYPARAFYPPIPLFDRIPRTEPWRFAAIGYALVPNASALYELEDVRGYESDDVRAARPDLPLWCISQPVWYNRVDDPTPPFVSFLNVRYVFVPPGGGIPPGWRVLGEDTTGRLIENPAVLPRAFVPRRFVTDREPWRQMEHLKVIRDFADAGVVEGPDAPPRENGAASVRIVGYFPERLELEIDAKNEALVGTSVTRWPGWRLTVDGREKPLLVYNWAFLGFASPPGRHRAVLHYSPGSFRLGAAISGASLLAAAGDLRPAPATVVRDGESEERGDGRQRAGGGPLDPERRVRNRQQVGRPEEESERRRRHEGERTHPRKPERDDCGRDEKREPARALPERLSDAMEDDAGAVEAQLEETAVLPVDGEGMAEPPERQPAAEGDGRRDDQRREGAQTARPRPGRRVRDRDGQNEGKRLDLGRRRAREQEAGEEGRGARRRPRAEKQRQPEDLVEPEDRIRVAGGVRLGRDERQHRDHEGGDRGERPGSLVGLAQQRGQGGRERRQEDGKGERRRAPGEGARPHRCERVQIRRERRIVRVHPCGGRSREKRCVDRPGRREGARLRAPEEKQVRRGHRSGERRNEDDPDRRRGEQAGDGSRRRRGRPEFERRRFAPKRGTQARREEESDGGQDRRAPAQMRERSGGHRERKEDSSGRSREDDPAEGRVGAEGAVRDERRPEKRQAQERREPDDARAQGPSFQTSPSGRRKRGRPSGGSAPSFAPTRIRNSGFQPGAIRSRPHVAPGKESTRHHRAVDRVSGAARDRFDDDSRPGGNARRRRPGERVDAPVERREGPPEGIRLDGEERIGARESKSGGSDEQRRRGEGQESGPLHAPRL